LNFGQGDAAASPHLVPALRYAALNGLRRARLKTTGTPLLEQGKLEELIGMGILLYEIEFLGTVKTHDKLASRYGAYKDACKAVKLIKNFKIKGHPIETPFLFLTIVVRPENIRELPEVTAAIIKLQPDRIIYRYAGDVSLSKSVSVIQSCIKQTLNERIWPVLSGFPFCVAQGLEYHCQEVYDRQGVGVFPEPCSQCTFNKICCGLKEGYTETFGCAEIQPIVWHRYSEVINRLSLMDSNLLNRLNDRESPYAGTNSQ
jgi:hypothetical protein